MNCGKSWFVDADHTCSRADTTVCRSSYKSKSFLMRCTVAALQLYMIKNMQKKSDLRLIDTNLIKAMLLESKSIDFASLPH